MKDLHPSRLTPGLLLVAGFLFCNGDDDTQLPSQTDAEIDVSDDGNGDDDTSLDTPDEVEELEDGPCEVGQLFIESFDLANPSQVDILVVVDNSPGMGQAQESFSQAISGLVSQLNEVETLDYHLGIVSTDVVDVNHQGALQTGLSDEPECLDDLPLFVTHETVNGPDVAMCNVLLGEGGDDFEAGLDAVRWAMVGPAASPGEANDGFFREDARLAVIIFSDEDDCSSEELPRTNPHECEWDRDLLLPLETYIGDWGFFSEATGRAGFPVDVVAIVGPDDEVTYVRPEPPEPVCTVNGEAYHGRRYASVVDEMGERGGLFSICVSSYESTLNQILAEHLLPRSDIICPRLELTEPPISVVLTDIYSYDAATPLSQDSSGYTYLGPNGSCDNGAIQIAPDHLGSLGAGERIEVHYCSSDGPY